MGLSTCSGMMFVRGRCADMIQAAVLRVDSGRPMLESVLPGLISERGSVILAYAPGVGRITGDRCPEKIDNTRRTATNPQCFGRDSDREMRQPSS